jgi:YaiO family outer membrane protein
VISPFILLCIVGLIVAGHFVFAIQEWVRMRGQYSAEIEIVDSSVEIAETAFRELLARTRGTDEGNRSYDAGTVHDTAVIARGDFECSERCRFAGRIDATGDATVGEGSELDGLVAQGSVCIARGVRIKGSLHAAGPVNIDEQCRVGRYVTSETGIRLRGDFAATAIVSPAITTSNGVLYSRGKSAPDAVAHPSRAEVRSRWFSGSFEPAKAVRIDSPLVIEGRCTLPAGSEVNADLRVKGAALIGAGSLIRASVVCDASLHLEDNCRFERVLLARGDLRLGARVTGSDPKGHVAAYAEGEMVLGSDSFFSGRLYAAEGIRYGATRFAPTKPRSETFVARLKRLPKLLGLATLLCSGMAAQTDTPLLRMEVVGHVIAGDAVPAASGGEVTIRYLGGRKLRPTLQYRALAVGGGRQENISVMSVADLTPRVFFAFGASKSQVELGIPAFFPRWRADAELLWKPVPTGWIVGLGTVVIRYQTSSADLLTLTVIRYLPKWVLQTDAYVNRSRPGDLWSASGLISVETGRYGRQQLRFRAGAGREAYRLSVDDPAQFRHRSYSFDVLYRKWLSSKYGLMLRAGDQKLTDVGQRWETAFGLFFDL